MRKELQSASRLQQLGIFFLFLCLVFSLACRSHMEYEKSASRFVGEISLFRGVDARANGRAALSPNQFQFNLDLSTFSNPAGAPVQKPCNYEFQVQGIAIPPTPGDSGPIVGLLGYNGTFDNDPPGHWSISAPPGTTPADAAAAVSVFAQANRDHVVNGTQNNCG